MDAKDQILFVERRNSGATGAVQEVGGGAPVTQRRRAASMPTLLYGTDAIHPYRARVVPESAAKAFRYCRISFRP